MNKKIKAFLVLLLFFILVSACKDSSTEPERSEPREFNFKKIEVPEGLKSVSDSKAQLTVGYVSLANTSQIYAGLFQIPQGASNDGEHYTWANGPISITMFQSEDNGNYTWKLVMNGTEDGVIYSNWVAMEASQTTDGENGWVKIYEDNSTVIDTEWSWSTESNGKYTFSITNIGGGENSRIVVVSNPDKSGEVLSYENNIIQSRSTWATTGAGEWWEYDSQGNVSASGTWNVPT